MSTVRDVRLDCIPAAMQIHSEGNDRHAAGNKATLLSHLSCQTNIRCWLKSPRLRAPHVGRVGFVAVSLRRDDARQWLMRFGQAIVSVV
jgi:hypothetical protein